MPNPMGISTKGDLYTYIHTYIQAQWRPHHDEGSLFPHSLRGLAPTDHIPTHGGHQGGHVVPPCNRHTDRALTVAISGPHGCVGGITDVEPRTQAEVKVESFSCLEFTNLLGGAAATNVCVHVLMVADLDIDVVASALGPEKA